MELQGKYSTQAYLIEEASAAIKAAEAEAQQRHQELLDAQHDHQVEIESAISRAVEQYKVQLSTAQSSLQTQDHEHQLVIQKLQDKIQSLEVSLASQVNLLSMGWGLLNLTMVQVFAGYSQQRGVAWYDSQDQAFSFHKQVRFEDWTSSTDMDHNPTPGPIPKASTPHCVMSNLNHTFDISQILPFASGTHQDAATITAEVLAAAMVQASKEFHHMCKPKITKLKGGIQLMQK